MKKLPRWSNIHLAVLALAGTLAAPAAVHAQGGVLPPGTVPVLRSVVSGQAVVNAPVAGAPRSLMTIDQASQRAIIDWKSFDISADSEVLFRHLLGTSASTLNRIYGLDPSVIQGKLGSVGPDGKAASGGQILLINQNGILFDRGAQVNTRSLVASTLNLSNDRYLSGALTTGGLTTPAFAGGYDDKGNTLETRPDGRPTGNIGIGSFGPASAAAPALGAAPGGSILLFAPRIDNDSGVITAPDGQVMLAAGRKVYLALNEDQNDNTLRGLRVEVEAQKDGPALNLTNLIRNAGTISADRGNVSLAALAVNQEGRVSAKTAVQSNGSIFLKARTLDGQGGTVTLAKGSTTEVQPDTADKSTVANSVDYASLRGVIDIDAKLIDQRGSVKAQGGSIALRASDTTDAAGARVYLDAGSETSVAGTWTDLPYDSNLLTFRVTSNELKNSPDQKTGVLRGAEVTVDLRQANPIFDLSGYIGAQQRTVSEKAAAGGVLSIDSSGAVIQRPGATLDASGGGYRYGDGVARTSKLLGSDGRVYDIGSAPKDRSYTALLDSFTTTDARWGQTLTFSNPLGAAGVREAGYVLGKAGGSVTILSEGLVLDGTLKGGVTIGNDQLAAAPKGGTLVLGSPKVDDQQPGRRTGPVTFASTTRDTLGATFTAASALPGGPIQLSAPGVFGDATTTADGRVETGFSELQVYGGSSITVPAGVNVQAPPGGAITLRSLATDVAGRIAAPGGQIVLSPSEPAGPLDPSRSVDPTVTVRAGAEISTAGLWINTSAADGSAVGPLLPSARGSTATTGGGSVSITAPYVQLDRGSVLDVSGGGSVAASGRVTGGNGGALTLTAGQSAASTSDWLQADLRGFSLAGGGSLSVTTPRIVVDPDGANAVLPSGTTRFTPSLFADHGFGSLTLTAPLGLTLSEGTTIVARQRNWLVEPEAAKALAGGGRLASIAEAVLLPDATRAQMNVTLNATGASLGQGRLLTAEESAIVADPRARITLTGTDGLTVAGRISAAGGDVRLSVNGPALPNVPAAPLTLAATAAIDTAGTFVARPGDSGLQQGTVIGGGTVTLQASNTGVVVQPGARIDVSGIRREVDVVPTDGQATARRVAVDGNAGAVIVKSEGGADLRGTLLGRAPSASAAGGSFALELVGPGTLPAAPDPRVIAVSPVAPQAGQAIQAWVSAHALAQGGFDKLRLQAEDAIVFSGDQTLSFARGVRLDAPLVDLAGDARVLLAGASVGLGPTLGPRVASGGSFTLSPTAPAPAIATRSGNGTLTARADTLDLTGTLVVNGAAQLTLQAEHDIRASGRATEVGQALNPNGVQAPVYGQVGGLTTTANVTLQAAQVYPTTRSSYTISVKDSADTDVRPGGFVLVQPSGTAPGDVYSAGGALAIRADNIVQGGRVIAPLGTLELDAKTLLELAAGGSTSVSANGLVVPYGSTLSGVTWTYADTGTASQAATLDRISTQGKRVTLSGATVDVQKGATVDLRGGGDVQATEFVPGSGGDTDTTLKDNTFAIIPTSRLAAKPVDADIAGLKDIGFGAGSARQDTAVYDSIRIAAGGPVPAGDYALLPARYALLPDAYLVQVQTGSVYAGLRPGQQVQLANGSTVVAGQRMAAGTGVVESQSIGLLIRPGSAARQESDYTLSTSQFFADAAARSRSATPPLPRDAGQASIADATVLNLAGTLQTAAAAGGRIAQVDIAGPRIAVVDQLGSSAFGSDVLQVAADGLSALDASVLLGGTRATNAANGVTITTQADSVVVANSAAHEVKLPELLLSANGTLEVRDGAALKASGNAGSGAPAALTAGASGALLRLSAAGATTVDRGATPGTAQGDLRIGTGAVLAADGSLLLDATRSAASAGQLRVGASGTLSLASSRLSLGEVAGLAAADAGLMLSNTDLASFAALASLTLKGYAGIDLVGNTVLGGPQLGALVLDTPTLRGATAGGASALRATTLTLQNTSGGNGSASAGTATLTADAQTLRIGTGGKALAGFASVQTRSAGDIVGQGSGSLAVSGDWTLGAQNVRAAAGSDQTWSARDAAGSYRAVRVEGGSGATATAAGAPADGFGGRLALEGRKVDVATTLQATGGVLSLAARGGAAGDDVALAAGARVAAAGGSRDFNGSTATVDAGRVALTAAGSGQVTVNAGAAVDVSAAAGGRGGTLQMAGDGVAIGGSVSGASAEIDVARLAALTPINDKLNAGGFAESRALRVRSGDLAVAAGDSIAARDVSLAADAGAVSVAGTVGTGSSGRGALVDIRAAQGVTLAAGSRIRAGAAGADGDGGQVSIGTRGGTLTFAEGALIDVHRGANGDTGSVTFSVARSGDNAIGTAALAGTVDTGRGATDPGATVALEAQRSYSASGTLSAAQITGFANDHQAFVNAAAAGAPALVGGIKAADGSSAGAVLRGATELVATGDLAVSTAWDLTSAAWLAGGQPGTLTLRAAGNLTLSNALGSASDGIRAGATWGLRAVAGADLAAASPMAVLGSDRLGANKGDLLLSGANVRLRTGTGRIDLAAGRDIVMDNVRGAVYTAGLIGATDAETNGNNRWAVDGGDITLRAGRDVLGATSTAGDLWVTDWLRRPRLPTATFNTTQNTDWWTYRPNFQQGVGTLAGGDIDLAAGRNIANLSAALPTSGRTFLDADGARKVDVRNGGDLRVTAGRSISGGTYFVARGEGLLRAGGDIGSARGTTLLLGDGALALKAGGSIALQGVANPTALQMTTASPTRNEPSFGPGSVPTFFTYAPDSAVSLQAEGGDITLQPSLGTAYRSTLATSLPQAQGNAAPVWPPNVEMVAFNGGIVRPDTTTRSLVMFPSSTGQLRVLADGNIERVQVAVSDLAPAAVSTPASLRPNTALSVNTFIDGSALRASGQQPRIAERDAPGTAYAFDVQALAGDMQDVAFEFPAASRLLAGRDIVGPRLTLQNLAKGGDTTVVQAVSGDIRGLTPQDGIEIRGPGRLLLQAGRDVDLGQGVVRIGNVSSGGLLATGNAANSSLPDGSARITVVAGVTGTVNLGKLDAAYTEIKALNGASALAQDFYARLASEPSNDGVLAAKSVAELAARDAGYQRFVSLDTDAPRLLSAYQAAVRGGTLPLGATADAAAARALYAQLNAETDATRLTRAGSLAALAAGTGGDVYKPFLALDARYPRLFADYLQRRGNGALPTTITPIVFSDALAEVVAQVVKPADVAGGRIASFNTSIQTYGGSGIDLLAPGGDIVVGLTTPSAGSQIGVLTNAGGAIQSVLSGSFNINQGKVLTAQGGDILIFSGAGSIDAGRGAQTSQSTPPPVRVPVFAVGDGGAPLLDDAGNPIVAGFVIRLPASATGSGIRTLTSDPDGAGPASAPKAGDVFLFAPAGSIDAGEAGIRSSGNIVLNAQVVRNAASISAAGSSVGVPQVQVGSVSSALASSGANTTATSKGAEEAAANAAAAATKAAAAAPVAKPTILSVEVLGFGDRNCKEDDKNCFAK